jgi:hypothetical protein
MRYHCPVKDSIRTALRELYQQGAASMLEEAGVGREVRYFRPRFARGLCPVCGELVHAFRSDARYCSVRCRVAAHRAPRPASASPRPGGD